MALMSALDGQHMGKSQGGVMKHQPQGLLLTPMLFAAAVLLVMLLAACDEVRIPNITTTGFW